MTGFEPVKGYYTLNDLANRRFQPLSHISILIFTSIQNVQKAQKDAGNILASRRTLSSFNASNSPNFLVFLLDTIDVTKENELL